MASQRAASSPQQPTVSAIHTSSCLSSKRYGDTIPFALSVGDVDGEQATRSYPGLASRASAFAEANIFSLFVVFFYA